MDKDPSQRARATDLGTVRISNEAIATIASISALEVKGVFKMGGGMTKTLYEAFFKKMSSRGVKIEMKDSDVKLTVGIIVEYGADIPRIADEVQENVKRAVEKMAGLLLSEVDVVIEGVHAPIPGEKDDRRKI